MATQIDYAALSALVYNNARGDFNYLPTPTVEGWTSIATPTNPSGSFTAEAYRNGNDIVIAFKGTDTNVYDLALDMATNLTLGFGGASDQLKQAALFYAKIKTDPQYQGCNISFTGHSLGGGLASIMSVWFNLPATTFAEAPFENTALNLLSMVSVATDLTIHGYGNVANELSYADLVLNYSARQSQVTNYYVQGEVLQNLRTLWPTVLGGDNPITIGGGDALAGITLHSMNLHAALLMSQTFDDDTVLLPKLLTEIFDSSLYAVSSLVAPQRDFLTSLLKDQIKVGYDNANGLLARFSSDIAKLTNYGANLKDGALGKALIDTAIADYYFMQSGFTKDFFTTLSDGISFDLKDIGTDWSSNKTVKSLDDAIIQYIHGDSAARQFIAQDNAWTIQSGDTALNATGTGANNDAMIGGTSGDALDGGSGNDFLYGGDGTDTLTGGMGDDMLMGGTGTDTLDGGTGADLMIGGEGMDTYYLEGNDTIRDTDRNIIVYQGQVIAGAFLREGTSNTYSFMGDNKFTLTFDSAAHLTVNGTDSITFEQQTSAADFENGDFGITLYDSAEANYVLTGTEENDYQFYSLGDGKGGYNGVAFYVFSGVISGPYVSAYMGDSNWPMFAYSVYVTPPNLQIDGAGGNDYLMGMAGSDSIKGGTGNDRIIGDGIVTDPDPRYNPWGYTGAADILQGEAGKDYISGGFGDDLISGGADQDFLDGGTEDDTVEANEGNDVLAGGLGNDLLSGGDGDDFLYGDSAIKPVFPPGGYETSLHQIDLASMFVETGYAITGYPVSVTFHGFDVVEEIGAGGDDFFLGGIGNDTLLGGGGNDTLLGEADHDALIGGSGDDYLDGGDGNDWLVGDNDDMTGSGNDTLSGGVGDDLLYGLGGNDTLLGEADQDRLEGGEGDDYLDGGAGNDLLYCGARDDNDLNWRMAA